MVPSPGKITPRSKIYALQAFSLVHPYLLPIVWLPRLARSGRAGSRLACPLFLVPDRFLGKEDQALSMQLTEVSDAHRTQLEKGCQRPRRGIAAP